MEPDLAESDCGRHGLDRHIQIHEAGHALAALDIGIPFRRIVIYGDEGGPTFDRGFMQAAAAIEMLSEDCSTWVLPDRVGALRFVLAGSLSEVSLLDHAVEGGYDGDFKAWRVGLGETNPMTKDKLDDLAGGSFDEILIATESWAHANKDRIAKLAGHLATLAAPSEMHYDEVVGFDAGVGGRI